MSPTLAFCPPHKATTPAMVRKPPTHVMMVRNVRSTTEISVRAPRSSESNQGCVETCMTPSKCHQHLCFALPQGNHPHGGAKTSNTCHDGSKCPINHRNLNGCPKVVRIQSGVCGNLCDDPDMHVFTRHQRNNADTCGLPPTRQLPSRW